MNWGKNDHYDKLKKKKKIQINSDSFYDSTKIRFAENIRRNSLILFYKITTNYQNKNCGVNPQIFAEKFQMNNRYIIISEISKSYYSIASLLTMPLQPVVNNSYLLLIYILRCKVLNY